MACIPSLTLENASDLASILTAIAALAAWIYYLWGKISKRLRLEQYLRDAKANAAEGKKGQRTIIHLMAACGLTEAETLDAAFRSKRIKRPVWADPETGRAEGILLEYQDEATP